MNLSTRLVAAALLTATTTFGASRANAVVPLDPLCTHSQNGSPGITTFTLHITALSGCYERGYVLTSVPVSTQRGPIRAPGTAPINSVVDFGSYVCDDYGYEILNSAGTVLLHQKMGDC